MFCNIYGGYIEPTNLHDDFKRLLRSAQLPDIRFHDLRHSAATILLGMGVHPKIVQEILGHSNISMTMDTYSHVFPSMQQEAMDRLGDLFRGEDQGVSLLCNDASGVRRSQCAVAAVELSLKRLPSRHTQLALLDSVISSSRCCDC